MLNNKLESLLWSLEMIKRSAGSAKGCVIKDTGGFVAEGQVDDLITLVKERMNTDNVVPHGVKTVEVSERTCSISDFDKMIMTKNFGGAYNVEITKDDITVAIPKATFKNQIELDISNAEVSNNNIKCLFEQEISYVY